MHGSGSHASNPKVLLTPQEPVKPLTPESTGGRGFSFRPTAKLPKKSDSRRERWLVLAKPLVFRHTVRFLTRRVPKIPAAPSPDDPTSDPRPFPGRRRSVRALRPEGRAAWTLRPPPSKPPFPTPTDTRRHPSTPRSGAASRTGHYPNTRPEGPTPAKQPIPGEVRRAGDA